MHPHRLTSCTLLLLLASSSHIFANPQGFQLIQGEAKTPVLDNNTLTVETGHQAILHWQDFSIAEGETTRFVMPDSSSHVLNRVIGSNLSEIYGMLEANGKILLVNPKGVLFGENAYVDTSAFIASSLDVLDADFLKNGDLLFAGNSSASIVNLGTISAWDGDVALIGYQVVNEGEISTPNGVAALAAGTQVLFRPLENERIAIRVSVPTDKTEVGIENSGAIQAIAAELKADGNLYQYAIKDSSKIDALGLEKREGRIFLVAEQGALSAQGSYTAKSETKGGDIRFLGNEVRIEEGAEIIASGEMSGGQVLIGGDYQGDNPEIANAKVTYVAPNAHIAADATLSGDGGKVILWGDTATGFYGFISAQGGATKGDGGFIEVSSPGYLAFNGLANAKAPFGKTGMLLLDPTTVMISTGTDSNDFGGCLSGGDYNFGSASSTINNVALQDILNTMCSVTINASSGTGSANPGSITLVEGAPVTWTSTNSLTLQAYDSTSSFITLNDLLTASGGGSLNINDNNMYNATLTIQSIGTDDAGFRSTASGGSVVVQIGTIAITGGGTGFGLAYIECDAANTPITINTESLTLTGGTGTGKSAYLYTDDALLSIVCNGPLMLTGGTQTGTSAIIQSDTDGDLTIQCYDLTMSQGSSFTSLMTTSGNLTIDGTASNSGAITLNGFSSITTNRLGSTGGAISIGKNGTSVIPTNLMLLPASGPEPAEISNQNGGDITCNISGNYTFTAGTISAAEIITGGAGDISLAGNQLTLTGGTGGNATANISASDGNVTLTMTGAISLDGSANQASVNGSDITIGGASLTLTAGTVVNRDFAAVIGTGDIMIACDGEVELTAATGFGFAQIATTGTGTTLSIESTNLTMMSEATGIGASLQSTTGNLTIDGFNAGNPGSISLMGNSTISTTTGDIIIGQNGNTTFINITGGTVTDADASIITTNLGSIAIACSEGLTLQDGILGYALIAPSLNTNQAGNLSIESGTIMLSSTFGNGATLQTGSGNITIDGFNASTSGSIEISGNASINTQMGTGVSSGNITIGSLAPTKQLPTTFSITGTASGPASVFVTMSGAITSTIAGTYVITSGASQAFIATTSTGDITLTGESLLISSVGATAAAYIQTGLNDVMISCSDVVELSAGTAIGASIFSANNLTIQSIGLTMNGGTTGIATLQTTTGDINIDGFDNLVGGSGPIMFNGNNTVITTTTGAINIGQNAAKELPTSLMIQGDGNGNASGLVPIIYTQSGGNITSTILGAYELLANATLNNSGVSIQTQGATGSNNISLTGTGLTMTAGGGSVQVESQILSSTGNITLDMRNGSISMDGPSDSGAAYINAQGMGGITIMAGGGISITDNCNIWSSGTGSAGNIVINPAGPVIMTTTAANSGGPTIFTFNGGAIAITGDSLTMTGGIGIDDSPNLTTGNGGDITVSCSGVVTLNGGPPPSSNNPGFATINADSGGDIFIQSTGLTMNGNSEFVTLETSTGTIHIDGYDANNSGPIFLGMGIAEILTNGGGDILIGQTNGYQVPTSLTLEGTNGLFDQISTNSGGNITCTISGDYSLTVDNQPDSQTTINTFGGGNISLTGGSMTLTSGSGGFATSMIQGINVGGTITIVCDDLTVTGGMNNSPAGITTAMGDINITCSGNCTFSDSDITGSSPSEIQTFGSDLTLIVPGNASFMGFATVSTPAPGNLTIIAGANLSIGDSASITATGTTGSSLTLVCDNDFPTPPAMGPGEFNLTGTPTVSTGMGAPLRIFTSNRTQNTISAPINGVTFTPGPELKDTATEQWGTYYPSSIGGVPSFTIFYKFGYVAPPPSLVFDPQPAITAFAVLASQGFFDFSEIDRFDYFDWYRFSDFTTRIKTGKNLVNRGNYSLRKRRGEFLKNNGPRGFAQL